MRTKKKILCSERLHLTHTRRLVIPLRQTGLISIVWIQA